MRCRQRVDEVVGAATCAGAHFVGAWSARDGVSEQATSHWDVGDWFGPAALHPGVGGAAGTEQLDASTHELSAPCL